MESNLSQTLPIDTISFDVGAEKSASRDPVSGRLQGLSIAGFKRVVASAGGRWRLKKGVGPHLCCCGIIYPFLALGLIVALVTTEVLLHRTKSLQISSDPKALWVFAFFFPLLLIVLCRLGYAVETVRLIKKFYGPRRDLQPSWPAFFFPCIFPWIYEPPKTTEYMKSKFVLTATAKKQCSYLDLLRARPDSSKLVGEATVFVSHSYSYLFLDVVDAISAWAARNPRSDGEPHYFYFDLLVNCQHGQPLVPFSELRDTFSNGVHYTEQVLLLLDVSCGSAFLPDALTRSWCIFEIATALSSGKPFEVITPPINEDLLVEMFLPEKKENDQTIKQRIENVRQHGEALNKFLSLMCSIDIEFARATEPHDKTNISRMITEDLGGYLAVNQLVIGAMRDWVTRVGIKVLAGMQKDDMGAYCIVADNVIGLLRDQGKFDEARDLCRKELEQRREILGVNHKDTLSVKNSLIYLFKLSNNSAAVAELEKDSLQRELDQHFEECTKTYGFFHTNTQAALYAALENCPLHDREATTDLGELLSTRRRTLGDSHPETLLTAQTLIARLPHQERVEEARAVQPQPKQL